MADELSELDAAVNDPALLAAEAAGRAAFAVDLEGEIVWAGDAAFRLIGAGGLDAATGRALARMATSGGGGMLRLRLGGSGARAAAFQARPIFHAGAPIVLALEALQPVAAPETEAAAVAEDVSGDRDVAAEEGVDERVEPRPVADAPIEAPVDAHLIEDDRPPDPRRDFGAPAAAEGLSIEGPATAAPEAEAEIEPPRSALAAPEPRAEASEPFRFAFEIDAASRVTLLSPELARAVGPSASRAIGRSWSDVSAELGLDPADAVAAALARHGSWSDLEISWPIEDGRRLPLSLSALPMFDRGRSFVGFRGLGRSAGEPSLAERPAPDGVEASQHAPSPPAMDEDSAAVAAEPEVETVAVADAPQLNAPAREEPPILIEVAPEPPVFAGNVVPLREVASAHEPAVRMGGLSSSEESAFDEIARRLQSLGVRVEERGLDEIDGGRPTAVEPFPAPEPEPVVEDQRELPFAAGSDELLRLIDRLPVGALVLRGGEVAHANRPALELLGCRELGDLTGRGADTLFAEALPQDRDAPAGGVMRLIAANGGEVEVDARLSTIAWGGAPATLVTLRRAESSQAAAKEFEQREREFAAVLDIATDGVMTLDGAGRILSVNRRAEAVFGFDAREVLGSLFTLSLAPESRRSAFDCLDATKAEGAAPEGGVEVLGLSRHGGSLPLLLTIAKVGSGGDNRFCAVLRDVGPWKRAEEELIAARRQAERANAQKSEFLAKIGHEIRTPLNAIIGFAEVMMEERLGPVGSPRYKDYLKDIHTSGGHLVKMVDDLLDITRIETGKLKLDFVAVDLNEIASQAAALLQPQANRDRVIIRTSLARGLPHVLADRRSVRQIMTNLASNAVKLSRPGGQVIVATAMGDAGQAVFRVRDAGAGMSKQEIARAFEPFRPLAVADNDTGFGLGLPLTRALAEANQAALALQSEVGQGTLAEVTFPASRVLAS